MAQTREKRAEYLKAAKDPLIVKAIMSGRYEMFTILLDGLARAGNKLWVEKERSDSFSKARQSNCEHELIEAALNFVSHRQEMQKPISYREYDRHVRSQAWANRRTEHTVD